MSSYYEKILATGEVKCIDEEVPFEIPKGWEWCRLRDVIYPPKYGTSSKSLSNGDVPVLRMGNIQDGEVVYDKLVFSNIIENIYYKMETCCSIEQIVLNWSARQQYSKETGMLFTQDILFYFVL